VRTRVLLPPARSGRCSASWLPRRGCESSRRRRWRNIVSQLAAAGDGGWVQNPNFIICGNLAFAGALGLWRARVSRAGSLLVGRSTSGW
jgi:hypothetical protein